MYSLAAQIITKYWFSLGDLSTNGCCRSVCLWQCAQWQVGIAHQHDPIVYTKLVNVCATQLSPLNSIVCRFVRSPAVADISKNSLLTCGRFIFFWIGEATGVALNRFAEWFVGIWKHCQATEILPPWRLPDVRIYNNTICLIQCWESSVSNGKKSESNFFLLATLIHAACKLQADATISRKLSSNWVNQVIQNLSAHSYHQIKEFWR